MSRVTIDITSKHYQGAPVPVIQDMKMNIAESEFISIVGPSGAGKSTLLNIIAGLDTDYTGEVCVGNDDNDKKVARIAYVFQSPRLLPWLTVEDNLKLVLKGDVESETKIDRVLTSVGLADRAKSFPDELSGGMQRRVSLARAFVVQPTLLLLDEPFVSVDAPTAKILRELLLSLWQETKPTVIFVSHVLQEALALADRVVFLSSSPAKVVYETAMQITRPRLPGDAQLVDLQQKILNEHPDLLSGLVVEQKGEANAESNES